MNDSGSEAAERPPMEDKLAAAVAEIIATCDEDQFAAVSAVCISYRLLEEEFKAL